MRLKFYLLLLVLAFTFCMHGYSQIAYTWIGSEPDSSWGNAALWSPAAVPGPTDTIKIPGGTWLVVDGNRSCAKVVFEAAGPSSGIIVSLGRMVNISGDLIIEETTNGSRDLAIFLGGVVNSATISVGENTNNNSTIFLSSGSLLEVTGDITFSDINNTMRFGGSGTLRVGGNFTGGTLVDESSNQATVDYNSSDAQSIHDGPYSKIIFSGGGIKTLTGSIEITQNAAFTNGIVVGSSANLVTFNTATGGAGTVLDASNASFVSGPVSRIATSGAFTFPVGKTGWGYHPIEISNLSATATFIAEYFPEVPANTGAITPPVNHLSACEYWQLDRTAGSGNAAVTLSWAASSNCGTAYVDNIASLTVARFDGTNWVSEGQVSFTGNNTAGTITSNQVTSFSSFALGSTDPLNPLPVKLISFTGAVKNNVVNLQWKVEAESGQAEYIVERSANGRDFVSAGRIPAVNSPGQYQYNWSDAGITGNTIYYRLKMISIDRDFSYSSIIRLSLNNTINGFTIYPNPVRGRFLSFQATGLSEGEYRIKIFNQNGQEVHTSKLNVSSRSLSHSIQLPAGLNSGVYNIQLAGNDFIASKQFVVE